LDQSEHYAYLSTYAGFLKYKLTLEISITLSLMLIVTSDAEFHMKHHTELQHPCYS